MSVLLGTGQSFLLPRSQGPGTPSITLEVSNNGMPSDSTGGPFREDESSMQCLAIGVGLGAIGAIGATMSRRKQGPKLPRHFQDERLAGFDHSGFQGVNFRVLICECEEEPQVEATQPAAPCKSHPVGFSTLRPSGRLNSEFANGRLALLSGLTARPKAASTEREAVRRRAETTDAAVEVPKELPDDEGYGWNVEELEYVEPYDPAKEVGVTAPLGYFDPLGFCKRGDKETFRRLRANEIKHGRVAMMASIGCVVQHFVKLPIFNRASNASYLSQWDALFQPPAIYVFSIFAISLFFLELSFWAQAEDKEPGNFGDPFNFGQYTTEWRNREINNGRFAMFAIVGIVAAQLYTGKDAVQQLGLYYI